MSLGNMHNGPNLIESHGLSMVIENGEESHPRQDKDAQSRLTEVKDVLKNSKTLKEQLKGVCVCYDTFT
jgi:hypothetical protein